MEALKIALLVLQLISCVVLTTVILLQSGKEDGMGILSGKTDTYLGKGKAATLDKKLADVTKWIAGAFVLLTLFLSLLYTAL